MPITIKFEDNIEVKIRTFLGIAQEKLKKKVSAKLDIAAQQIADLAKKMLQETTSTWETPPNIISRVQISEGKSGRADVFRVIEIYAGSEDQIFKWVNDGTPAHPISPKGNNPLIFPRTFTPKSQPGQMQAGTGYKGAPYFIGKVTVYNPGITARNFTAHIQENIQGVAKFYIEEALK